MENTMELQEIQTIFNEDTLDVLCADDTIIENIEEVEEKEEGE